MSELKVTGDYDLNLTMYPSYVSSLFVKKGGKWVKVMGKFKGLSIWYEKDTVKYESEEGKVSEEVVKFISGIWFDPVEYFRSLRGRTRELLNPIVKSYRRLRLAVDPWDKELIFLAVALSQRTDYHVNVLRWFSKLRELSKGDISKLKYVGRSYQIKRVYSLIKTGILEELKLLKGLWSLRRELMKYKFLGPKTVNAYLLFTGITTSLAPVDVHFVRFINKIGLFSKFTLPSKKYCTYYDCYSCPLGERCLVALALKELGPLAGWLQTVAYVHDKLYCSKRACLTCNLSEICRLN
ncbi:MAG: hypothetical protein B6U69_02365 [Thermofilum sp. ex4484_15]|nr:MAG: hypothetical protein B6U69_02365 [Thermofilum sp. ex4484_15]